MTADKGREFGPRKIDLSHPLTSLLTIRRQVCFKYFYMFSVYEGCSFIVVIDSLSPKPASAPEEIYLVMIKVLCDIKVTQPFRNDAIYHCKLSVLKKDTLMTLQIPTSPLPNRVLCLNENI